MSDVEKKVVSVEFDNRKFDKNVKKSSQTFDEFKEKLQVKDVSKSFDVVVRKLSSLDVAAATVINNITNRVVNLGVQLVKSLSVDNISSGWDKFGLKTTSVATIAAQTIKIAGKELVNYEEKLEAINEQLDKLNWYTDETSYNFTDMVNTIGKFTAAGQDLDRSVNAMIGIANWAALSGQNASVASRAMYQLAQAMSKGNIQLIDWRSIETANMATMEFKQTVLDTAAAMGELTKQGENYISKTGKKITAISFSESLADKWFTSDILVATLEKYSAAVERVYELSEETGYTASEVMARYSSELDKFGLKAFKAAQEARTFADALNSVKDAVSTGWLNTFEKIFGGYDESRKLWTDLANELYEVFAEGGNFRNQILGIWNDLGGRSDLFKHGKEGKQGAFWNIYDAIVAVINKFKEVKDEVFSVTIFENMDDKAKDLAYQLKNITDNMQRFTEKIVKAVKTNKSFQGVLKGLFSILKTIGQVIRGIRYALDPIITLITGVFGDVLDRIGAFGSNLSALERTFKVIENVATVINTLLTGLLNILNIRGNLNKLFDMIGSIFTGTFSASSASKGLVDFFKDVGQAIKNFKMDLKSIVSDASKSDIFVPLYHIINGIVEFVKGAWALLSTSGTLIGKGFELIGNALKTVSNCINNIIDNGFDWKRISTVSKIAIVLLAAAAAFLMIKLAFEALAAIFTPLVYTAETLADSLYAYSNSKAWSALSALILSIGQSLLMISIAFSLIGSLDKEQFERSAYTFIAFFGIIVIFMLMLGSINDKITKATEELTELQKSTKALKDSVTDSIKEIKKAFKFADLAAFITSIGLSMIAVAIAFKVVGSMDLASWRLGISFMITFMGLMTLMIYALENTEKVLDSSKIKKISRSFLSFSLVFTMLARVIRMMSTMTEDEFRTGISAFGAMMSILVAAMALIGFLVKISNMKMDDFGGLGKLFISLGLMLTPMLVFIYAVKDIPFGDMSKGVLAIFALSAMVLAVGVFAEKMNIISQRIQNGKVSGIAPIFLSLAVLIATMGIVIYALKDISITTLGSITIFFIVLIGIMSAIASLMSSSKGNLKEASINLLALGGFGTLLLTTALSMAILSKVPYETIIASGASLLMLLVTVFVMIAVLTEQDFNIKKVATRLLALGGFGTLLYTFAESMNRLVNIPGEKIAIAVIMLMLLMGELLLALSLLQNNNISGQQLSSLGAMFIMLGAGLIAFAEAMLIMASVPWSSLGMSAAIVAGSLVLLVGAAALITKLKAENAILALGASFLMLGVSMALIGLSMSMIGTNLGPFLDSIISIGDKVKLALESLLNAFDEAKGLILEILASMFGLILDLFVMNFSLLVDAVTKMVIKFAEKFGEMKDPIISILNDLYDIIKQTLPNLMEILGMIFGAIINFFFEHEEELVNGIVKFLVDTIVMLAEAAPKIAKSLGETLFTFIYTALDLLMANIDGLLEKLWELLMTLLWGLLKILRAHAREFGEWVGAFVREILLAMAQSLWAFIGQIAAAIARFWGEGASKATKEWFDQTGDEFEKIINESFEINSPSKMTQRTGEYLMQGLVVGMENEKKETLESATDIMSDCVGEAIDCAQEIIDEEDTALVIRPVLDLSNVEDGAHSLSNIMSGVSGTSVTADIASKASSDIARRENQNGTSGITTTVNNAGDTYNNVFNITTNDPEEFAEEVDEILQRQHRRNNLAKGGV